jgi:hypothetical protein
MVEVVNVRRLDEAIARWVVGINPQQMNRHRIVRYDRGTRVSEHLMTRLRLNCAIPAAAWSL